MNGLDDELDLVADLEFEAVDGFRRDDRRRLRRRDHFECDERRDVSSCDRRDLALELIPCTVPHGSLRVMTLRRLTVICIPCLVRSVTRGCGTTGCPGTSRSDHCWAIVATTSASSIHANDSPTHWRGPPPNGKYANLGSEARNSGVQRSGSKRPGSG